jgi:hypothetical protein
MVEAVLGVARAGAYASRRPATSPVLAVIGVMVVLWLAAGVTLPEVGVFAGYELAYVLIPGVLCARALLGAGTARLRELVFGVALGHVLELSVFALTAAVGARELLLGYPLVISPLLLVLSRGRAVEGDRPRSAQERPPGWVWAMAGLCVAALLLTAAEYFLPNPLPGSVPRVSYGLDHIWDLSLAGEARHHWPFMDPSLAGIALPYHWLAAANVAAASQVSGLGLPLVFFRLYLPPLVVAAVLGLAELGITVGRRAWVGALTALLALLVGEIHLDAATGLTFANETQSDVFFLSPTFLVGLIFFVPLLVALIERTEARSIRAGWRWWSLVALLLAGCATAKATILPLLAAGLALQLAWSWWRNAGPPRGDVVLLFVVIGAYVVAWTLMYAGAGSGGLRFDPPGAVRQMHALAPLASAVHGHPFAGLLYWPAATAIGLAGAYAAPLIGLIWANKSTVVVPAAKRLMLGLLAAGLTIFLAFTHPGLSQVYFTQYGVIAALPLSALGLTRLWASSQRRHRRWLILAAVAAAAPCLAASAWATRPVVIVLDLAVAGSAAALCLWALATHGPRGAGWRAVVAALLAVAALGVPISVAPYTLVRVVQGGPLYGTYGGQLTPGLYHGLAWLRSHGSPDDVLAVNNYAARIHYRHQPGPIPDDYAYSAFAERRVFLEGWVYANRSFQIGEGAVYAGRLQPYPTRRALNDAVFKHADPRALATLARRYHVRYLLIDRRHARAARRLAAIATPVYANPDVTIYAVPPRPRHPTAVAQAARNRLPPSAHPRPLIRRKS